MNETSSSAQPVSVRIAETDASCRVPLFVLFVGAAAWLVLASVFALMGSLQFHAPNMFAHISWLTYGRVEAAAESLQLYGFALPAGIGVALWIFSRCGEVEAVQPWLMMVGAGLWHFGVLIGMLGILAGNLTSFHALEMPRFAGIILFLAYLVMGLWTALTAQFRRDRRMPPAQWFFLAALFWFPWIFSTANLLLLVFPVRGVDQSVIDWWYSNNLTLVWMSLAGLAAVFYLLPKTLGKKLHSEYLALFTFWILVLFGSWAGFPQNAPIPAWITSLSTVATVLTTVALFAVAINVRNTLKDRRSAADARGDAGVASTPASDISGRFLAFGAAAWVLALGLQICGDLPEIGRFTSLTWYKVGQSQLNEYGFFAIVMFGAIYYIVPRVTGVDWPFATFIRAHFWLAAVGVLLLAIPFVIGGFIQGTKLNDPNVAITAVTQATLPYLRASTLGDAFLLIGHLLLITNLVALSARYYRIHFLPVVKTVTAQVEPMGVRS